MTLRLPRAVVVVVVATAVAMAGCTDDEPEVPEVPSTTTPTGQSPTPTETSDTPEAESTVGVPELCSDLIPTARVAQIVETPMPSGVRRIFNDDYLESSGRTGRLSCEYGIDRADDDSPSPSPTDDDSGDDAEAAILEIAVSAYTEADVAAGRISDTVDRAGGEVESHEVLGNDGFFLRDDEDISLIFANDLRTHVITMVRDFVPESAEPVVLSGIANEILAGPEDDG